MTRSLKGFAAALAALSIGNAFADPPPAAIPGSPVPPATSAPVVETVIESAPAEAAAPNPDAGDLSERARLTGDWGGARLGLMERGLNVDVFATHFYQGVVAGGKEQGWRSGAKLDYLIKTDGGKMGLMKGSFLDLHAETRLGDSINPISGVFVPANTSLLFPAGEREITALTGVKYTQALSESFAVFAGKINLLDELAIRYSPGPVTNLPGLAGFMNTGLVFNPILVRTLPYSGFAAGAAWLVDGKPFFTLTAFDPQERATIGLEDLYARGVTLVADMQIRPCFFGKPGIYQAGAVYGTADYRTLDRSAYLGPALQEFLVGTAAAPVESGSWALYANYYQAFWVDPNDEHRTWGFFGQYGLSDGNPNPIRYVSNWGVGGRSPLRCRKLDVFGIGTVYTGLSDSFKNLAPNLAPRRNEYGIEMFYNYAVTPWCRLTGDLQIVRPSVETRDTTIMPGVRVQVIF
ncbi:MAG TPA: carbohydrate porin [Planctomycetia bacterium]|nr:carbohydrate porin [Planctomycetia bacterium]